MSFEWDIEAIRSLNDLLWRLQNDVDILILADIVIFLWLLVISIRVWRLNKK
jgi:hypothetical protein